MKPQAIKYRRIKVLVFLLLSLLTATALFGVLRRESAYIATVVENWEDGAVHRDFQSVRNKITSPNIPEVDHRTYLNGEEWAGAISATHPPDSQSKDSMADKVPENSKSVPKDPSTGDYGVSTGSKHPTKENHWWHGEQTGDLADKISSPLNQDNTADYHGGPRNDPDEESSDDYVYEDFTPISHGNSNDEDPDEYDTDTPFDQDTREALEHLKGCSTISCIQESHKKLKGKTKFNAPHFFLIGFQKCATTSVNHYLRGHPEYLPSVLKEAHYFTACQKSWNDSNCKANSTEDYINNFLRIRDAAEDGLLSATVDASVDYAWKGEELAREIRKVFPWLKIVVMMREPISRVISYTRMWTQKGIRVSTHKDNRIACDDNEALFDCLYPHLTPTAYTGHYAVPLEGWLKVWPSKQIHVIQFEEFVERTDAVMRRLKEFLGMDPSLPENVQLYNVNTRKDSGGSPMKRRQYRTLVEMARPDSERVATLLDKYGLFNKDAWMERWEHVWDQTLRSCNASRICMVNSN